MSIRFIRKTKKKDVKAEQQTANRSIKSIHKSYHRNETLLLLAWFQMQMALLSKKIGNRELFFFSQRIEC